MRGVGRQGSILVLAVLFSACSSTEEEPEPPVCPHPQEVTQGSGWIDCGNGLVHRPHAGTCVTDEPSRETLPPSTVPAEDECFSDADCVARDLGYCASGSAPYGFTPTPNRCVYACVVDLDCPTGEICACVATRGECRPATCRVDADCGPDLLCVESPGSCLERPSYACQTPADECVTSSDCVQGFYCGVGGYRPRTCGPPSCST